MTLESNIADLIAKVNGLVQKMDEERKSFLSQRDFFKKFSPYDYYITTTKFTDPDTGADISLDIADSSFEAIQKKIESKRSGKSALVSILVDSFNDSANPIPITISNAYFIFKPSFTVSLTVGQQLFSIKGTNVIMSGGSFVYPQTDVKNKPILGTPNNVVEVRAMRIRNGTQNYDSSTDFVNRTQDISY